MSRRPLGMPITGHPIVAKIYDLIIEQGITITDLDRRSGVSRSTISHWRSHPPGAWASLEAVLNVLGHKLVIEKCDADG